MAAMHTIFPIYASTLPRTPRFLAMGHATAGRLVENGGHWRRYKLHAPQIGRGYPRMGTSYEGDDRSFFRRKLFFLRFPFVLFVFLCAWGGKRRRRDARLWHHTFGHA